MNARPTLVACAVAAAFTASAAASPPMPFGPVEKFATGATPRVVLRTDVIGNGFANDLVTANAGTNDLTVFVNTGHGALKSTRVPVGARPGRLNAIDLDNDGKTDLVVLNQGDATLQLLRNDAAGGFRTAATLPVGRGPDRQLTWKGGLNSRVVVSNREENTISYFAFGADGSPIGSNVTAVGRGPTAVQNLDLDGDGVDELLVLNFDDGTVSVIEREANAAALPRRVVGTVAVEPGPTATGGPVDVDGDGRLDLVVANQNGNSVSVLRSRGDRTFDVATYRVGAEPGSVNAVDFNGDGKPDLVAGNRAGSSVSVLLNSGNGRFAPAVDYRVGNNPNFPVASDMDGDGILDLVVSSANDGAVTVLKGLGDGTFTLMASIPLGSPITPRGSPQLIDMAGEGNLAIAVALPDANQIAVVANLAGGYVRVVEYARMRPDGSDQYFMTAIKAEIEALDSGAIPGWKRTGDSFRAYERPSPARNPVCRFFSTSLDAHFYSADPDECDAVARQYADVWGAPESTALFHVATSTAGTCAPGLTPVYRVYDPAHIGHRYTIVKPKREKMIAAGWIAEGEGRDGVAMCAP